MIFVGSDITFIDYPTVDDWAVIFYFAGCFQVPAYQEQYPIYS